MVNKTAGFIGFLLLRLTTADFIGLIQYLDCRALEWGYLVILRVKLKTSRRMRHYVPS